MNDNDNNIQVPEEFFAEQQKLCQTMPKSKKNGGPYPAHIKKARRNEVFSLYFDYGYSARKIADIMNISRNTVNSDINYWYTKMEREYESIPSESCMVKILNRLELQRCKLREELDNKEEFHEKVVINKMILNIDSRLFQFHLKMKSTENAVYNSATKRLNEWMKGQKYDHRFITFNSLLKVSANSMDKITKTINEDKVCGIYH